MSLSLYTVYLYNRLKVMNAVVDRNMLTSRSGSLYDVSKET